MAQSFDYSTIRPNYNAVKINIKKPEVNAGNNRNTYTDDNGIYNAVNIEIDNPSVNTEPKKIYDYPKADGPVTYDMANINQIPLPRGFNVAYTTTNVILPKMEQELEFSENDDIEEAQAVGEYEADEEHEEDEVAQSIPAIAADEETDEVKEVEEVEDDTISQTAEEASNNSEEKIEIPAPNYTTVEAEKAEDNIINDVKIMEEEVSNVELKRPEIIPGDEITPDVDIPLVVSNLANPDYDIQAQQMEEIARISLDNKENAVPYIVREIFASLIDITKQDTSNLAAPTDKQVDARKKLIANYIEMENAKKDNKEPKLPYELTEADFIAANELSPMELAERNKEYALYTIAILAKIYTDEVEKQTGNIVPFTDLPGSAAIVDALRQNPNAGVKIAAIDALAHIYRPEYDEELNTLFTLAQADSNQQVALAAGNALVKNNG